MLTYRVGQGTFPCMNRNAARVPHAIPRYASPVPPVGTVAALLLCACIHQASAQVELWPLSLGSTFFGVTEVYIGAEFVVTDPTKPVVANLLSDGGSAKVALYVMEPGYPDSARLLFHDNPLLYGEDSTAVVGTFPVGTIVTFMVRTVWPTWTDPGDSTSWYHTREEERKFTGQNRPGIDPYVSEIFGRYGRRWALMGHLNDTTVLFGFEDGGANADFDFNDIVFTVTGLRLLNQVTPPTPFFEPPGGQFADPLTVTIAIDTALNPGPEYGIYYSTDGTTYALYTGPLTLTNNTTISAFCRVEGSPDPEEWLTFESDTVSATFTHIARLPAPVADPASGVYTVTNCLDVALSVPGHPDATITYTLSSPGSDPAFPTYAQWQHHQPLILNTTSSGVPLAEMVTAVPVAVRLDASTFIFADAAPDGADIRLSKPEGTPLPCEIEFWDRVAQRALVWVLVDTVLPNNDTQRIYLHSGNPTAPSVSDGAAVFRTADDFGGVWHLAEEGNTLPDGYHDATGSGMEGTGWALFGDSDIDAAFGRGQQFDGAESHISVSIDSAAPAVELRNTSFTVSGWLRCDTDTTGGAVIGQRTAVRDGPHRLKFGPDGDGVFAFGLSYDNASNTYDTVQAPLGNPAEWHHWAGVFDMVTMEIRLYRDGVLQSSSAVSQGYLGHEDFLIGAQETSYHAGRRLDHLDGTLDEVRVATVARNDVWLAAVAGNGPDGRLVQFGSHVYSGPVGICHDVYAVGDTVRLTAQASMDGFMSSPASSSWYVLTIPRLPTPQLQPPPATYDSMSITVTVSDTSGLDSVSLFVSIDGGPFLPYTGPVLVGPTSSDRDYTVSVYATRPGFLNSDTLAALYQLHPKSVTVPVAAPPGGVFHTDTTLSISLSVPGLPSATIYYTLDGTDPTSSSTRQQYGSSTPLVTLTGVDTVTLRAYAESPGLEPSGVLTEVYRRLPSVRDAAYLDTDGDGRIERVVVQLDVLPDGAALPPLVLLVAPHTGDTLSIGPNAMTMRPDGSILITLPQPIDGTGFALPPEAITGHIPAYEGPRFAIRDGAAPVVTSAAYRPLSENRTGLGQDTLHISFSEPVDVRSGQPLTVAGANGDYAFMLSPLGVQGDVVVFLVTGITNDISYPTNGDLVRIAVPGMVCDSAGLCQNNAENHGVPLDVTYPPVTWRVSLSNNPFVPGETPLPTPVHNMSHGILIVVGSASVVDPAVIAASPPEVSVTIYDAVGNKVRTGLEGILVDESVCVAWDGRNQNSRVVGAGTYLALVDIVTGSGRKSRDRVKIGVRN